MAALNGLTNYNFSSDFYDSLVFSEAFGQEAIIETGKRAKSSCNKEWKKLADLTLVADHRRAFWSTKDHEKACAYSIIYAEVTEYARKVLRNWDKSSYNSTLKKWGIKE